MTRTLAADYLVVGAGAAGMAFTDALVDHSDARVVMVDRRDGPGGHWLDAYPFVRLHQASAFYGVASTPLGDGRVQEHGPETGLHERATVAEITAYYARVLADRMVTPSRVEFLPSSDYLGEGRIVSRVSGAETRVSPGCRVVDAGYLAPAIPARTPPPFEVADGARVVPVNDLVRVAEPPGRYVVVGSGKTATDAIVWLRARGVDPGAICWVRPRDPWMLNRAVIQPDPAVFLGMAADLMEASATAGSLDDLFLRLEDAGVMLRVDRTVTPTMARTPTLGAWELDVLRSVEDVVRLGHVRRVERGRLTLDEGTVEIPRDALVVHCAAAGVRTRPRLPVWAPDAITLQPIRAGFPCFGAALIGHVEATRSDDSEKNRICPPSRYPDTLTDWATMTITGTRAAVAFGSQPDLAAWASTVALNPVRVPPGHPGSPALDDARARLAEHGGPGLARLVELAGEPAPPIGT